MPEQSSMPEWWEQDKEADLALIERIRPHFLPDAQESYQEHGPGTVIFDLRVPKDNMYTISYAPVALIPEGVREGVLRLVETYNPEIEFVVTFLRSDEYANAYKVRPLDMFWDADL